MKEKYIDIIIPFADSINQLSRTIKSLNSQHEFIDKLIIIASGKSKNLLLVQLNKLRKKSEFLYSLEISLDENSYPTAASARNKGFLISKSKYIGFMDSGMIANKNWLSSFYLIKEKKFIRLGCTSYNPGNGKKLISSLLTYGTRVSLNTVPGTIIASSHFVPFNESLRYGEDIIWMDNYKEYFNKYLQYQSNYIFFSEKVLCSIKKYYTQLSEAIKIKSTYKKSIYTYTLFSIIVYLTFFVLIFYNLKLSFCFLFLYLIFRFLKKNKLKYLFSFEGLIILPIQIILDYIRINVFIKNLIEK